MEWRLPFVLLFLCNVAVGPAMAQVAEEVRTPRVSVALGADLTANASRASDTSRIEEGIGLGLRAGLGLGDRWAVHGRLSRASIRHGSFAGSYQWWQLDLGGRYHLARNGRVRPYLEGTVSTSAGAFDRDRLTGRPDVRGAAVGAGGGISYRIRPSFSVNLGADVSKGALTHGRVESGAWLDLGEDRIGTEAARSHIGLTWHP